MKDVIFDERFYSEKNKMWTYYFTAPANMVLEMFSGRYNPEDVASTEISIDVPCEKKTQYEFGNLDGIVVRISPTQEYEDGCTDYDWEDIDIPDSEILELLEKAMRQSFTFEEYWNSGMIIKDLCAPGACSICEEIRVRTADTSFDALNIMSKSNRVYAEIIRHARQIYNCTCNGQHKENVKPFKVSISEVLVRTVIIFAESEDEACELTEDLCNAEVINLDASDFESREVDVLSVCDADELSRYQSYEEEAK